MHFEPPRPRNDDERILPLINVVFLLLIFFMLTGALSVTDPFEIAPPNSISEAAAGEQDLLVQMAADGTLALDGEVIPDTVELREMVAVRIEADRDLRVRFKADGRSEATAVITVMDSLREAGVVRLHLLTLSDGG